MPDGGKLNIDARREKTPGKREKHSRTPRVSHRRRDKNETLFSRLLLYTDVRKQGLELGGDVPKKEKKPPYRCGLSSILLMASFWVEETHKKRDFVIENDAVAGQNFRLAFQRSAPCFFFCRRTGVLQAASPP